MNKHPNRYPGTDDKTGWPLKVSVLCRDLVVLCHVALSETPTECADEPADCPFHGRWPVLENNSEPSTRPEARAPEAVKIKQEYLI